MSFLITPICFSLSSLTWFFISNLNFKRRPDTKNLTHQSNYFKAILGGFWLFGDSIWVGFKILFSDTKYVWLVPGYAVALYAHRFLENNIAPAVARRYYGESAWSQIMVGGSNLGELLGALFVFIFTNLVCTPMPWLRLDALLILIVWYIPYWHPPAGQVSQAWIAAATFLPISFGWAAGDVSLAAYIQACLARLESKNANVSALGAVMAFLYSFYIVTYAVCGTLLGRYLDQVYNDTGGSKGGDIHGALVYVAGVQFTLVSFLVFCATFVPQGSFAFNPPMLHGEKLDTDLIEDEVPIINPNVMAKTVENGTSSRSNGSSPASPGMPLFLPT